MSFFDELKRRNVFRVGIAYLVAAWVLLQILDVVGEILELPTWGGKLLLVIIAAGFFVTTFVAWVFELTPEGIKRESEVDRSRSVTAQTGRKLNVMIIALMAVAITYLLFDKFLLAPRQMEDDTVTPASHTTQQAEAGAAETLPTVDRLSIAVLPFDNRSNRDEDRFFTDGIHDDLLTTISRIGSMKVISRTSVMEYRGTTKKIPDIAAELGVANVLEGAVQRSGSQVRINVQLIDAKTDEHLWANTYDRELTAENLFAIQSEISTQIAEALQATLSPDEKARISQMPTSNLDAYDAYLLGKQLMATRHTADLKQATEEFLKAVELDPQFALAWVGVADSHYLLTMYTAAPRAETIAIREDAIDKALSLDPLLGEAYASLAEVHEYYGRHDEMEQAFRKAIELNPNYATAYQWYSVSIIENPLRSRERLDLLLRASELDPRSMIIGASLANEYFVQGLFSRGEQQALRLIELYPDFPNGHHLLVDHYYRHTGEFVKAMEHARALARIDPGGFDALRHQVDVYVAVGDYQAATEIQDRIADLNPEHYWAGWADLLKALSESNAPAIREVGNWILQRAGETDWIYRAVGGAHLIAGDTDKAKEVYLQGEPNWLIADEWERLIRSYPDDSCAMSWILINTGDPDLGRALLEQTVTYLERELPAAIEHADRFLPDVCYLVAGDTEKALASLETQLAHGHIYSWNYNHNLPMYSLIDHDPSYRAMIEERDRHLTEQREAIENMGH
jgi:TolB-like protein/Tfp pilus assembly protein PilF